MLRKVVTSRKNNLATAEGTINSGSSSTERLLRQAANTAVEYLQFLVVVEITVVNVVVSMKTKRAGLSGLTGR